MKRLKVVSCGTNYTHAKGFTFTNSAYKECYIFAFFKTDFISSTKSGIRNGRAYSYILYEPYANIYHTNTPDSKSGFVNDWMYLKGSYVDELVQRMNIMTDIIVPVGYQNTITDIIQKTQFELAEDLAFKEERIETLITELFIELGRNDNEAIFTVNKSELEILTQVRRKIQKGFNQKWTIEKMAKISGYSSSYFLKLYKKYYGKSPMEDLIDYRVKQAKFKLESNTMNISEVASDCGFASLYYFSRIFKQKNGISPTEYREAFIKNL